METGILLREPVRRRRGFACTTTLRKTVLSKRVHAMPATGQACFPCCSCGHMSSLPRTLTHNTTPIHNLPPPHARVRLPAQAHMHKSEYSHVHLHYSRHAHTCAPWIQQRAHACAHSIQQHAHTCACSIQQHAPHMCTFIRSSMHAHVHIHYCGMHAHVHLHYSVHAHTRACSPKAEFFNSGCGWKQGNTSSIEDNGGTTFLVTSGSLDNLVLWTLTDTERLHEGRIPDISVGKYIASQKLEEPHDDTQVVRPFLAAFSCYLLEWPS